MSVLRSIEGMSHSPTVLLAGLVVLLLVASYTVSTVNLYLQRRAFKAEHGCQPIKKRKLKDPIFGSDEIRARMKAAKEHRLLESSKQKFEEMGTHTFTVALLKQNLIFTREPENIKTILSLRFKDFGLGQREANLGRLLGRGIFTTDGEAWSHSRALIRPNFARDQVADLDAFERHIQTLFKLLPRDGSTVDLQELFFQFTIDSATEFLFGQSTNTLKASLHKDSALEAQFAKSFNKAQEYVAGLGRITFAGFFGLSDKAGEQDIKICHEFVDQFVDEAVRYRDDVEKRGNVKEEKYVFLHQLAQATKDKKRLRDELLNVLLAGRDTTASLLSNMWFMLAKQPEVFEKLRREVEDALNGEIPTYDQLRNLKYLKYCMNECMLLSMSSPSCCS
jgi:cytochrome P450